MNANSYIRKSAKRFESSIAVRHGPERLSLIDLRSVAFSLLSFELTFVLFLFAGRYKADPRFEWIPVDLTALFFGLSVLTGLGVFLKKGSAISRSGLVFVLAMVGFIVWVFLSLIWTPGRVYASQKAFYLATLTLWAGVAPALIIGPSLHRMQRYYTVIMIFGMWTLVESFELFSFENYNSFLRTFGASYLALGYTLGLVGLILLGQLWFYAHSHIQKAIILIVLGAVLFTMLASGGRGPLLAFLLTFLAISLLLTFQKILTAKSIYTGRRALIIVLLVFVLAASGVAFLSETGESLQTIRRLEILFSAEDGGGTAVVRMVYFRSAMLHWFDSPIIGHGIGSYPLLDGVGDIKHYPHNIILEILIELGLVGLLFFCAMLFVSLSQGRIQRNMANGFVIVALSFVIFTFFTAQVSIDLADNRQLFMSLGLLAGSGRARFA